MALCKSLLLRGGVLLFLATLPGIVFATDGDIYTLLDDSSLRQGPDSSYASSGVAKAGGQAVELEEKGPWIKVRMDASGDVGWLYADSLELWVASGVAVQQTTGKVQQASANKVPGQIKFIAPLFEDGAVSQKAAPVDQKVAASSKSQHVVEASALDQKVTESAQQAPSTESQPISEMIPQPVIVADAAEVPAPEVVATEPAEISEMTAKGGASQPVIVANALSAPVAPAMNADTGMKQVTETTTIRTGPGPSNDVLGWVGKGAHVQAVGRQGDWLKVSIPDGGRTGWIEAGVLQPLDTMHAETALADTAGKSGKTQVAKAQPQSVRDTIQVEQAKPVSVMPVATRAAQTAEMGSANASNDMPTGIQSVSFIKMSNLRAGPDNKYDVVAWAGKGANARELARKGDWVRVRLQQSGRIGWAYKGLVKQINPDGALPVATVMSDQVTEAPIISSNTLSAPVKAVSTSDGTAGVVVDPLAAETRKQLGKQTEVEQISSTTNQPSVSPVVQTAVMPVQTAAVQNPVGVAESAPGAGEHSLFSFDRKANLRAGPDVKFDVVSWAGIGSYAYGLDRKGDWSRVQMQDSKRIGWVYNGSLKLVKAGIPLPVAAVKSGQVAEHSLTQAPQVIAQAASEGLYVFKQTGNLRAGPGKQYDVVGWGGRHEAARIINQKGDWRRVRMTMSSKVGWVSNSTLIKAGSDHAAVVSSATASVSIVEGGNHSRLKLYRALRTEPLRAEAMQYAGLNGWIAKGDAVTLLEQRKGWMRVKPQGANKQAGWIKTDYLEAAGTAPQVAEGKAQKDLHVVEYQDRISKREAFNFSYAALETALNRVPVEDINVRIDKDDLQALFRKETYDKSYFDIRVRTGRHHLAGRIKVLGSSTRIFKKKSLLIKLDKESTHWYGRRRIALRSMASDKALMREWMAWKLLAALGMKVPEVHFTRVSFNHGEQTGLYLNIEWMGKHFLADNNLDVNGGFYQPNDASHCGDLNTSENMNLCFDKIAPQDEDYSMLSTMAKAVSTASVDNMESVLTKYFNVESVMNWITVNALVTNGDTYNKNYWLHYSPANQKWTMIPWDYNLTFGRVYDPFGVKPFKIFNDNFQYYYSPDVGASNPLKDKVLRNPKLRARLETKLKHLLGLEPNGPEETFGWFSPIVMQARIGNLAAVVGKEVYKDTFLKYGEEEFTKTYESLMHYVTAHDYYLKAKLKGPYKWQPSPPFDPNAPPVLGPLPKMLYGEGTIDAGGQSVHMTDQGWGYFVARLNLDEPVNKKTQFKVRVEGGATPKYLPPAQAAKRCIRRSWVLSTETPGITADGDLMLEYTQENSKRTEVPVTLHEELLELWVRNGSHWRPLKTEVNEYANTLTARGVHVESGHIQRFVACSPF